MRSCLILGAGRSGTSMVAGTLASAGYFMGDNLTPARDANPKGFFEDWEINEINEELLAPIVPPRMRVLNRDLFRSRPAHGQRWLSKVAPKAQIYCPVDIAYRIQSVAGHRPFCFKDPRFCYTLPAWRPFLDNVVFVCVFRHPAITAASILKECKDALYLKDLRISFSRAVEIWSQMYTHVLDIHRHKGVWLFIHYDQMLTNEGLDKLEKFLDAPVDRSFPDSSLSRSILECPIPLATSRLYQSLCQLAGYSEFRNQSFWHNSS